LVRRDIALTEVKTKQNITVKKTRNYSNTVHKMSPFNWYKTKWYLYPTHIC